MTKIGRSLLVIFLLVLSKSSFAAIFCVRTAAELQAALILAASNNQDDEVRIVQGTYIGNFVYATAQATEAFDLSLAGGYTAGCASQVLNPENTILDGNQNDKVLVLLQNGLTADLAVKGLTLRNGKKDGSGGGLYVKGWVNVSIESNTISGNKATPLGPAGGGGIYASGGNISITKNTISGNSALRQGGGVEVYGQVVTLNDNMISRNTLYPYAYCYFCSGAGVYANGGAVTLSNNTISKNSISLSAYCDQCEGGGVFASGNVILKNNTISGNTVSNATTDSYGGGGGVALYTKDEQFSIALYNNAFWENSGVSSNDVWINNDADGNYQPTPISLFANNFDQSAGTGYWTKLPIMIHSSNLNKVDPKFVNAANDDYHLQPNSPMINAGYLSTPNLPDFDIEGKPRVLGASVDIGAYEYDDGSTPKSILSVAKTGSGTGTVTSNPTGINCGSDCAEAYVINSPVTLTGMAATNSTFDGWSGDGDCSDGLLTMNVNKQCTATFNAVRQLTITKAGLGNGTVTSSPSGINCGSSCSAWFYLNQSVQLSAIPDSYSRFSGWSGNSDCIDGQVTLTDQVACTATFDPIYHSLLVLLPGTGSGTVTSSPTGINCGTDCREDYRAGTTVTLTATAAPGSVFNGWAGACSGNTSTCQVQITDLTGVTANFTALVPGSANTLYVTSTGGGTVTSSPTGITCGTRCDSDYNAATAVTLTPTPNIGLTFNGWRGACSGTSTCQIAMTLDRAVMAAFGNTYPSQMLVLQQEQLADSGLYSAPRLIVLGPELTVAAGSHLTVEAGEQIKFLPGFKVENTASFKARINPTLKP